MLNTVRAHRGMVTAPHHLASEAGLRVLRDGGNAIEATIAMAATLSVVYPHMTGIGGDGFWLVAAPGSRPVGIEACGRAARAATPERYLADGYQAIPTRGPLAANTVAATVSGWEAALALSAQRGGRLPLARLLEDAIHYATHGFPVTASQADLTSAKLHELEAVHGFAGTFLVGGKSPSAGASMKLPALAETLRAIASSGPDTFYRGDLSKKIVADLRAAGSLVDENDLAACQARIIDPLSVDLPGCRLYNFPPPTQGLSSLMILALFSRLGVDQAEGFDHLHGLVEATKQAFLVRDRIIGDPDAMVENAASYLDSAILDGLAAKVDRDTALAWPMPETAGDTVWMGATDGNGLSTSFIQSIYFEFGSGIVSPQTGITWQNRGSSFSLTSEGPRCLAPGRKPFHTLNPAMAVFEDGRQMAYGTMGGEGQPQTQAALFSRYAFFGQDLQQSITAPRWLLGRTWGDETTSLKIESRVDSAIVERLRAAGHLVELLEPFTPMMGHAGAIVRHSNGLLEGANDPRSDGQASGY